MKTNPAIDVHAHAAFPEVEALARQHPDWQREQDKRIQLYSQVGDNSARMVAAKMPILTQLENRLALMDGSVA